MLTQMSEATVTDADTALAVYGTLAPGKENHGQVAMIAGEWRRGTVRGRLAPEGWGAALGYPALVLDPDGPTVDVQVLESGDLPAHWERLDEFEGPGYRRVPVSVELAPAPRIASIYVLAEQA